MTDQIRRRRSQRRAGGSRGLAPLVVCQTHPTVRTQAAVALRERLGEAVDSIITFSDGYPARAEFWSCLLFNASGVPFFFQDLDLLRVFNGNANSENRDGSR